MTTALANQYMTLGFDVVRLLVIPVLAYVVTLLLRQGTFHIRDQRVRAFVVTLVSRAQQVLPATDAAGNKARYNYVATALHAKFPFLPEDEVEALIEAAVLNLHTDLGLNFHLDEATATVQAPAAPALDTVAIAAALTKDLEGLVAPALAPHVAELVSAALVPAPAPEPAPAPQP